MNAIRGVLTVFMACVLTLAFLGWRWSSGLPSPKLEGARLALGLAALASLAGMALLWKVKPEQSS